MESPVSAPRPRPRRKFFGLLLLGILLFAAGVLVGPRVREWVRGRAADREYEPVASARVLIHRNTPRMLPDQQAAGTEADFDQFRTTQAELVKSRLVLNSA